MLKLIRKFFLFFLIILFFITFFIGTKGYFLYKNVVSKISIEDKINEIKSDNFIDIDNISPYFLDAIVAIEDHRFYKHKGVDFIATIKAISTNFHNKTIVTGGSSITQQLAKNMYFSQEQKFERKVAELFIVNKLEKMLSKSEILELYVNSIYYGSGYYGILSASYGYFNKNPKDLSISEATVLAGIPNAPSIYSLNVNKDLAYQRQRQVIEAMVEYNYLSKEEANKILEN